MGAGEGGGGTLPPSGPRHEASNLYQRPLAHTNPDVAVRASRRHVRRDPTSCPPLAFDRSGSSQEPAGARHSGSYSSRTPTALSWRRSRVWGREEGGHPKAGKSRVGMPGRTFPFISTESVSVIDTLPGGSVRRRHRPPGVWSRLAPVPRLSGLAPRRKTSAVIPALRSQTRSRFAAACSV